MNRVPYFSCKWNFFGQLYLLHSARTHFIRSFGRFIVSFPFILRFFNIFHFLLATTFLHFAVQINGENKLRMHANTKWIQLSKKRANRLLQMTNSKAKQTQPNKIPLSSATHYFPFISASSSNFAVHCLQYSSVGVLLFLSQYLYLSSVCTNVPFVNIKYFGKLKRKMRRC